MNPNDVLAGLNLLIAAGWFAWCLLFLWAYVRERPAKKSGRWFLLVFGAVSLVAAADLGTTGVMRVIDEVAFPGIPHALLPDFNVFPLGITILIAVRTLKAIVLWGGLFLVVSMRNAEDRNE